MRKISKSQNSKDLTTGPIGRGLLAFAIPLFLGQLLQQLYNVADAWVVGNFANNNAFAAVSSTGSMIFLIIGFFSGVATGGGVVISKYFGAKNMDAVDKAVHTNFLFGIIASVVATVLGLLLAPWLLRVMKTPEEVMPDALMYLQIYFGGVSTIIMYNIGMAIMRALGDSIHPLYYLMLSSVLNVVLDLLFVAKLGYGVAGAGVATVISQGVSAVLCIIKMCRMQDVGRLRWRSIRYYPDFMGEVIVQGLPNGIQNSVISIGNMVVQTNINSFGSYAMSGVGAYSKIEGFAFLPITSMSISLPTFISQNLGAKKIRQSQEGRGIWYYIRGSSGGSDWSYCLHMGTAASPFLCEREGSYYHRTGTCPDYLSVLRTAGIFPLCGGCAARLRQIHCAHDYHAGVLVRRQNYLCDHDSASCAQILRNFLGISADLVVEFHSICFVPGKIRLGTCF